jgi:predicted Fe-Mo cluster-binding NifX family protein
MKICLPISENRGLDSPLHGHFGSAPGYLSVDTETMEATALLNWNLGHAHGQCNPVQVLAEARPDAVVVAGLGVRALARLREQGIRVLLAPAGTVGDAVRRFQEGALQEATQAAACAGHGEGDHGPCHG